MNEILRIISDYQRSSYGKTLLYLFLFL